VTRCVQVAARVRVCEKRESMRALVRDTQESKRMMRETARAHDVPLTSSACNVPVFFRTVYTRCCFGCREVNLPLSLRWYGRV